ncbi:MAG: dihydropteroate synthase [Candidatus Omnitrophica bacterium]|nr:dihydropteroate synthase [Candidatus Omnitrophota bacterium]
MNARVLSSSTIVKEFQRIDVHPEGIRLMEPKSRLYCVRISGVNIKQANVLKQEALAVGADAAVPYSVLELKDRPVDVILIASLKQYKKLAEKLKRQFFNLGEIGKNILEIISRYEMPASQFSVSKGRVRIKDFMVMGILNITPDSFSDGGKYYGNIDVAVDRAIEMESEGAAIIDIGGESSRPEAKEIDEDEEIRRVIPVIKAVRSKTKCLISCDTSRYRVAKLAIEHGADIINDVYALRRDIKLCKLIAEKRCGVVFMHMKGTPQTMQKNPYYDDVIGEICDFFRERIDFALQNGIGKDKIIIDPGIGFGKRLVDNLEIIHRLREFTCFGLPILLGTSRKAFIGKIAGDVPPEGRLGGTIASCVAGYIQGARIFRVHDVKEVFQALKVMSGIVNYGKSESSRT